MESGSKAPPRDAIRPNRTESGFQVRKPNRIRFLEAETEPNPVPGWRNRTESSPHDSETEPNPAPLRPKPNRIRTWDLQTEPGAWSVHRGQPNMIGERDEVFLPLHGILHHDFLYGSHNCFNQNVVLVDGYEIAIEGACSHCWFWFRYREGVHLLHILSM